MSRKEARQRAKELFEGMSREEFIDHLKEAGFEVIENGTGKVIFTEEGSNVLVSEKIHSGYYESFNDEAMNIFKNDLFEEHELVDHPKAELLFDLAWDYGHSNGFSEVAIYFSEMADLLK